MKNVSIIKTTDLNGNNGAFTASISVFQDKVFDGKEITLQPENIDIALICEEKTDLNGKTGMEGELLISKNKKADSQIDIIGNLLISGDGYENYELNEMGELIYNY